MSLIGLFVVFVVAIPATWLVLRAIARGAAAGDASGASLLRRELEQNGIATSSLPPAFFRECTAWANRVSRFSASSALARRTEFVKTIENLAHLAAVWIADPKNPVFEDFGGQKSFYRGLFEKYEIKRRPRRQFAGDASKPPN